MNRYTFRINLDQELSKFIKMGVNLTMSRNEYDNVPLGAGQNENASIMVSAAQFNPLLPIKMKMETTYLIVQLLFFLIQCRYLKLRIKV